MYSLCALTEHHAMKVDSGEIMGLLVITSRLALGPTLPPIQWVLGALSLEVKQLGHHSHPSSAKVKNAWSCFFTYTYVIMV